MAAHRHAQYEPADLSPLRYTIVSSVDLGMIDRMWGSKVEVPTAVPTTMTSEKKRSSFYLTYNGRIC